MSTTGDTTAFTLHDDCFRHTSERLTHGEALQLLRTRLGAVAASEAVALSEALGRITAETVTAPVPIPGHDNAAVDGYAFSVPAERIDVELGLRIAGRAAAGTPMAGPAAPGTAVRIFTGAVMPAGCDTVVMQEDVRVTEAQGERRIAIPAGLKRGANVRRAGEDVRAGEVVYAPGHVVRLSDIAALASLGRATVACYAPLRIAVLSTGNEVVRPGMGALGLGQVFDANAPMLAALANAMRARVSDLGVLPDDPSIVCERLAAAAREFDVVLTSGGASRGEEDHLAAALDTLGRRHLWQLAIKPGRPLMLGQIGSTVVVGLPGNPVAVFVCALMYVLPLLGRLGGARWREPRRFMLPAIFSFRGRKRGRREFWRAMMVENNGRQAVDKFRRDGSGLISSLRAADGLIDIPEDWGDVSEGDLVPYIPFSEFGIT